MKSILGIVALIAIAALSASAQQPPRQDPLLDHMTGNWTLQGTISGRDTTHDVEADWVLGHEYIRIHETSHEKNAQGQPLYEAIVFIGWDAASSQYTCLWLDTTGGSGLSGDAIGHGKRNGDEIAFFFESKDGNFHTTFAYNKTADTWQWIMDNENAGKLVPFARLKLTKK
ncbi:MAG TPA: hypothetical protein VIH56_02545 [Candidatus Acidoferrales bacterium]